MIGIYWLQNIMKPRPWQNNNNLYSRSIYCTSILSSFSTASPGLLHVLSRLSFHLKWKRRRATGDKTLRCNRKRTTRIESGRCPCTLTRVPSMLGILFLLLVGDVFVGHEEQNHLTLFILNGHNVQKTPELCSWREREHKTHTINVSFLPECTLNRV